MMRTGRIFLALPLFLALASGCTNSATPSKVHGKITYNGTPVTAGSIVFYPESGGVFQYALSESGYSLSDLPEGPMVVTIETETANPAPKKAQVYKQNKENPQDEYRKRMEEMGKVPEGPANPGVYVKIPPRYGDKAKTPLRPVLTRGSNELNFELKDED